MCNWIHFPKIRMVLVCEWGCGAATDKDWKFKGKNCLLFNYQVLNLGRGPQTQGLLSVACDRR